MKRLSQVIVTALLSATLLLPSSASAQGLLRFWPTWVSFASNAKAPCYLTSGVRVEILSEAHVYDICDPLYLSDFIGENGKPLPNVQIKFVLEKSTPKQIQQSAEWKSVDLVLDFLLNGELCFDESGNPSNKEDGYCAIIDGIKDGEGPPKKGGAWIQTPVDHPEKKLAVTVTNSMFKGKVTKSFRAGFYKKAKDKLRKTIFQGSDFKVVADTDTGAATVVYTFKPEILLALKENVDMIRSAVKGERFTIYRNVIVNGQKKQIFIRAERTAPLGISRTAGK